MIDSIPMYATVECADGHGGQTSYIVINPTTRQATHLVVQEWNPPRTERLVPVDEIAEITADKIHLRCTKDELQAMDPFVETQYIQVERPHYEDYPGLLSRDVPVTSEWVAVQREQIPPGQMVVRRGAQVEATDGYVGRVGEILVDAETGEIAHLVLRVGHLWGQKEVTIPISAIDRAQEDTVYLKLDQATLESMPAVPVKQREGFDEGFAAVHAEWEASRRKSEESLEASFHEWGAEIQSLEAKAAQARAETKAELDEQIDGLRAKLAAARADRHEKMEAQLRAWQADIEHLRAGTNTPAEAKVELVRQLDLLSQKWQALWARWAQDLEAYDAAMGESVDMISTGMTRMAAEEQAESKRSAEEARTRREQAQARRAGAVDANIAAMGEAVNMIGTGMTRMAAEEQAESKRSAEEARTRREQAETRRAQAVDANIAAMGQAVDMIGTGMANLAAEEEAENKRSAEEARTRREQAQAKLQNLRKSSGAARSDRSEGSDEAEADL